MIEPRMDAPADKPRGPRLAVVITILVVSVVLISAALGFIAWSRYPG